MRVVHDRQHDDRKHPPFRTDRLADINAVLVVAKIDIDDRDVVRIDLCPHKPLRAILRPINREVFDLEPVYYEMRYLPLVLD